MPRPVGNKEYVLINMSFMQDETVQKAVNVNNRSFQTINSADLPLIGHSSSTSTLNDLLDRAENRSFQSVSSEYRDASSRSSSTLTLNDTLDSAENRLFQPVNSDGLGLIMRNSSTLTLNNLLDSVAGNELAVHHRQTGSQFSLNDLLDAMGTEAAVSETAVNQYGDCIIKSLMTGHPLSTTKLKTPKPGIPVSRSPKKCSLFGLKSPPMMYALRLMLEF